MRDTQSARVPVAGRDAGVSLDLGQVEVDVQQFLSDPAQFPARVR